MVPFFVLGCPGSSCGLTIKNIQPRGFASANGFRWIDSSYGFLNVAPKADGTTIASLARNRIIGEWAGQYAAQLLSTCVLTFQATGAWPAVIQVNAPVNSRRNRKLPSLGQPNSP